MQVIPLKYGAMFKRAFSDPEVFQQFAKDILNIEITIDQVHTEYEYPKPIGFVRSQYDLFAEDVENRIIVEIQQVKEGDFFDRFLYYHLISMVEQVGGFKQYGFDRTVYTIVVLTSTPRNGSMDFGVAISDMNPIDERGKTLDVYPHRLLFLCPRQANENTPPKIKKWLDFIEDSLDGNINEADYPQDLWKKIIATIETHSIDPELLAEIKDDMAWDEEKKRFGKEVREEGIKEGREKGKIEGREEGVLITAKKMKQANMDINIISNMTGLSLDQINNL